MFHAGQQIGPYTLTCQIGRGGFGEVWLAERRTKFVTIKVAVKLPHDEQVDYEAIKREATLWEQASGHPNILPIIDADEYNGQIVIVSEYAPSGSLEQWLKQSGKMPVENASEMIIQILDGLEFLHSRGIIHRDLKPANILLQGDTPRLADFGISRAIRTTTTSQHQYVSGTVAYMSPEALDGKRSVQTDIWSVGVCLYKLLTGTLPFPQAESSALLNAIVMYEPEPLPDNVSPVLVRVIKTALAKSPENRYKTAGEMREDLRRLRQEDISQTPRVVAPQPQPAKPSPKIIVPILTGSDSINAKVEIPVEANNAEAGVRPAPSPTKDKDKRRAKWRYVIPAMALLLFAIIGSSYLFKSDPNQVLVPFRKGNRFGFSDVSKNILIKPKYQLAVPFKEGLAGVISDYNMGFINREGREVIPLKYEINHLGFFFSEGRAMVKLNGKYGFIDSEGKEITLLKYQEAADFKHGFAIVKFNGKYGFINRQGEEITPFKYDSVQNFYDARARVEVNGKYGFIDESGDEVIPLIYDMAGSFSKGLAAVSNDEKNESGFIDKDGKEVMRLKFNLIALGLSEDLVRAYDQQNKKMGFIDKKTGKATIPIKYDGAFDFENGLAMVKLDDKWGFINKEGEEIAPIKYDEATPFHEGLAAVRVNNKWGFIDKSGKEIIPLKYDVARIFMGGVAFMKLDDKYFYIDKNGTEYYEP